MVVKSLASNKNNSGTMNNSYSELTESIKNGRVAPFYIFHGGERYLLERSLGELRRYICPDGLDGFNYRRYEGSDVSPGSLSDAINTLPVLSERTLIELNDFDLFADPDKQQFAAALSDLPEYVCVVINYDTIIFKPDRRQNLDKEILSGAQVIEFAVQDQKMLVSWIARHFSAQGKTISKGDAEYLILITGGLMASLQGEIAKVSAYVRGDRVAREDIDAVVTPVLDAVAYRLTDAVIKREHAVAMRILDELLRMREAPQMIIYSISLKMRQLLAARVCLESKLNTNSLMEICGIKHEFQARLLMSTARRTTLAQCREIVYICSETAYALNSEPEPEARLTELLARLASAV